jgi:hypothetical protein
MQEVSLDDPFWQRAAIAAIGPLVAAVIGTLGIGSIAAWITNRAQRRRQDHELREQIIIEMTQTATGLYLATQRYWRATKREAAPPERVAALREGLDEQYHSARVAGEALETRLRIYFATDTARRLWHATMDLLTVRYFQVIDLATDSLLGANAGDEHSGLPIGELRNPTAVLAAYRTRLVEATRAVLAEPRMARKGAL